MACVLLAIGIVLAFVGYYVKEGVEFFQGCCGGLVLWSMGISVMVLWYDMCRGATFFPDCDPLFLMIVVLVLSILSGVLTWKMHWERVEAFLSGFTTGAFAGGVYYIIMYRDELLGGFLDADSAKPYMLSLMIVMVLVGLVVAALTQVLFRQLLMMGTAIVGACLIVCSFLIFIPHWWSTYDWVAWGVLSVAGYLVQLLITPPEYEMMSKEEMQEYKKNKNKDGGKL
ncbi:unnamed protein product [Prorocentrum cordatum]|uniref:DUF4203 domain-containing protein n=1 Tax=Prorocentrum cordatum TaxID=2364126 RepID=A0ABN9PYX5_9DINO|nr:unnamed protein product [Polarella glacialis]